MDQDADNQTTSAVMTTDRRLMEEQTEVLRELVKAVNSIADRLEVSNHWLEGIVTQVGYVSSTNPPPNTD